MRSPILVFLTVTFLNALPSHAQEDLRLEALRSSIAICSQGRVERNFAGAEVEGFVSAFTRNLGSAEGDVGGSFGQEEVGAILDRTISEDIAFEVHRLYQDCLVDFILPLVQGNLDALPTVQETQLFTLLGRDASAIGELVVVELSIVGRRSSSFTYFVDPSSFRGVAKDLGGRSAGVYELVDASGMEEAFRLNNGDSYHPIFTFRLLAGEPLASDAEVTFSFSGRLASPSSIRTGGYQLGIRDLPVRL